MDAITFTATPRGTDQTITIDVTMLFTLLPQMWQQGASGTQYRASC